MALYELTKRLFDIVVSSISLIVLSPVFIGCAIAIKLDSPGPVFYTGSRVGRYGKPIQLLKFRTMWDGAGGPSSAGDDDPRITKVGVLLRKFKLNELPQLINVLRGDMSFVGPRPQVQWDVDLYTPEEKVILSIPPGITDYASIRFHDEGEILKGSADPDKDYFEKIRPEKIQLQLRYVRERSWPTDLSILFQTAMVLVASRVGGNR
ncbi:MAG: sugar transferase [Candidatus Eremiobacterota bacterium]